VVADDIHQNTYERATWKADGAMLQYAIKSGQPPEESGTLLP